MATGNQRIKRVAEEIKKEAGKIVQEALKDPRIGFVTVTKVELTRDLRLARIYYSLLGTDRQRRKTQAGLERSRGFVRRLLGERIKLRYTPEIVFKLDLGIAYSIHIAEMLDKIKKEQDR